MSILDLSTEEVFGVYLDAVASVGAPVDAVRDMATGAAAFASGRSVAPSVGLEIERRWYASLATGSPDWSVYATDYYLAEAWACWLVYSRKYLRLLLAPGKVGGRSFVDVAGDVRSVLDLGCGVGLTTAALKSMFPRARVVGTNLDGTRQIEMARRLGAIHGFEVATEPVGADLVFASEYFEHFPSPVAHLRSVLASSKPRMLLVANSFATRSIGHFERYSVDGEILDGSGASRAFGKTLRGAGYEKVPTGFWNSRPAFWRMAETRRPRARFRRGR